MRSYCQLVIEILLIYFNAPLLNYAVPTNLEYTADSEARTNHNMFCFKPGQ